jgi:4-hydroxybenzoate polyprenyltransferase
MTGGRVRAWIELTRPFTLLPPAVGMVSGACSALGAHRATATGADAAGFVLLGALMAALLNAASNALNQIHDLELDRVNKPTRPIPAGTISLRAARVGTAALYAAAVLAAFAIAPDGRREVGWIVAFTAVLTWAYSAPPVRARNSWWLGPLVIAVPRGLLLKVAGWGSLAPIFSDREPWILGGVFFVYILGAAPTKDFADIEGDRAGGASSLPIRFGIVPAARIVGSFLPLPGLFLAVLPRLVVDGRPLLTLPQLPALVVGALLAAHGAYVGRWMTTHPQALADPRDRRAWRHMYLLMMELQLAAALLYFVEA